MTQSNETGTVAEKFEYRGFSCKTLYQNGSVVFLINDEHPRKTLNLTNREEEALKEATTKDSLLECIDRYRDGIPNSNPVTNIVSHYP